MPGGDRAFLFSDGDFYGKKERTKENETPKEKEDHAQTSNESSGNSRNEAKLNCRIIECLPSPSTKFDRAGKKIHGLKCYPLECTKPCPHP